MDKAVSANGNRQPVDSLTIENIIKGVNIDGYLRIQPNYIRSDILMYLNTSFLAFKKANTDESPLYIHSMTDENPAKAQPGDTRGDTMIPSDAVIGRLKTKIKTILEIIDSGTGIDEFDRLFPVQNIQGVVVYANERFTVCKRATMDAVPLYIFQN